MPLSYPAGTLAEHKACRNNVAVFDVSHLRRIYLKGASDFLQWRLTNNVKMLEPMRAHYTHMLFEDGSVLDDLICICLSPNEHLLIVNAGNYEAVLEDLKVRMKEFQSGKFLEVGQKRGTGAKLKTIELETDSDRQNVFLAVQGPKTSELLSEVFSKELLKSKQLVKKNHAQTFSYRGEEILMLGTGYTGEAGVECVVPEGVAKEFLSDLVSAGASLAGLSARDILRLEAGYPLYGNELGVGITPLQAQLGWVVDFEKGDFLGREALQKELEVKPSQLLFGFKIENDRRPIRNGDEIFFEDKLVGRVTSGNYSPTLSCAIALGFLNTGFLKTAGGSFEASALGQEVEIRGRQNRKAMICSPTGFLRK